MKAEYENQEFNILISEVEDCLIKSSFFDVDYFFELLSEKAFIMIVKEIYENDYKITEGVIEQIISEGYRVCDVQAIIECMQKGVFESNVFPVYSCEISDRGETIKPEEPKEETRIFHDKYLTCSVQCEEIVGNDAVFLLTIVSNLYNVKQLFESILTQCGAKSTYINENTMIISFDEANEIYDISATHKYDNTFKVSELRKDNSIVVYGDENNIDYFFRVVRFFEHQKREEIFIENEYVKLQRIVDALDENVQGIKLNRILEDNQILSFLENNGICIIKDIVGEIPRGIDDLMITVLKEALNNVDTRSVLRATMDVLKILPPREETVLRRRYWGESIETLESIGDIYNVSRERIRQIESNAKKRIINNKLRKHKGIVEVLKLYSEFKNFFTENELAIMNLPKGIGIFLDNIMEEVLWDPDYSVGFYNQQLCRSINKEFESLPDELLVSELEDYSKEVAQTIGGDIDWSEAAYLIKQKYTEVGDFLIKGKLTLRVVLSYLIKMYFPNGFDIYDEQNIKFLRDKAKKHFNGFELSENNHAIISRIQSFCTPIARGVWKWASNESLLDKKLIEEISIYIEKYNSPVVPIQAILIAFKSRLNDVEIFNKYHLQGEIKKVLNKAYTVGRDYVFKNVATSFYTVLESFVKEAKTLVTKKDILRNFPGINDITIQQACSATKILNMNGYYVHLDNLGISREEKISLKSSIDEALADENIYHVKNIFMRIKGMNAGLFHRIGIEHYLQFYYLIKELFPNLYEFNRPFIARLGVDIVSGEAQVLEKMSLKTEIDISEVRQYAREIGTIIDRYIEFVDRNNDMFIFKNGHTVIRLEAAGVDDDEFENIDDIIGAFIGEKRYKNLCEFFDFWRLPKLNCTWNEWVLYSLINKYSKIFKGVVSSNYLHEAVPFVAKLEVKVEEIDFSNVIKTTVLEEEKLELEDILDFEDLE